MKINIIKIFLLTTVLGVMHVYMYGISVCAADVLSKTINISDNICWQYSPEDNTVYIDGEGDLLLGDVSKFIKKQNVVNVVINSGITSIGYGAFSGCQTIRTIEIPETVKTIDSKAFSNCFSLKEITFPENISVISKDSFMNCHGLKIITNNSKVDLSLSFIGLKTKWMVDNTKTDKICSGETANVIPKYIKIKYDTRGGRLKGQKIEKTMYGDVQRIKLPTAEKKGYIFAGWYAKGGTKLGNRIWNSDMKFGCFSSIYCPVKNIKLVATYKKVKVKKYSSDKIRITMKANRLYKKHKVAIEIADNNEMKNAIWFIADSGMTDKDMLIDEGSYTYDESGEIVYKTIPNQYISVKEKQNKDIITIKGLSQNSDYYIRFRNYDTTKNRSDSYLGEEPYGMRKI